MKKIIYSIFLLAVILMSCGNTMTMVNKKPIEVEWLVGIWKHKDKDAYEKWVRISDKEYKGLAYNMDMGFATITETMRIFSKGKDDWYFEATLKENNNVPVLFKWVPDPIVTLKFVNEKHDFPQMIAYKMEAFDVMSASISDIDGNKRMIFDYSRYVTQ
jgi:hypothetical protein